jgi:hypothetical protein
MRDTMVMAGVNKEVAGTEKFKTWVQQLLKGNHTIELPSNDNAKAERAVWIFHESKVGVDGKN